MQASGGVRSVADAEALWRAGASRVVVGTAAWSLLGRSRRGTRPSGSSSRSTCVTAIVRTRGWTESALDLDDAIEPLRRSRRPATPLHGDRARRHAHGAGHDARRRVVARSGLRVLAAGGIRSDADVAALERAGAEGAIVGRALLEGHIELARQQVDTAGP